ncbi:MAG: phytanoyl-CoA dioxygenase family protein [Deltaproteobacteria bacterium]
MAELLEDIISLPVDLVESFHRDGYAILENVLSEAEIANFEDTFNSFLHDQVAGMGRDFCDMSGPYDRAFRDFALVNAMLPRVYAPELAGNVFECRALAIARRLIGDDATLDYDQFLTKRPGKADAAFAWHQDLGYWPTGTPDTKTVTLSLALDDADAENGCLQVVPGTHREESLREHRPVQISDVGLRDGGHTLSIDLRADDRVEFLPVRRGSLTLHDERIVHGSAGNTSNRLRRTYVIAFRSLATVEYERSIGFTHSHNDAIHWQTHLEGLAR